MNLQTLRTFTTKIIFSKTPPRTLQRSREKKLSLKIIFQLSKSSNYPIKSSSKNPQNLIQNKKREITFQKNNSSKSLSQYLPREFLNYPKIAQSLKWSVSIVQVRKRDYLYSFPWRWFFKSDSGYFEGWKRSIPVRSDRFRRAATPESDLWCYSSTTCYSDRVARPTTSFLDHCCRASLVYETVLRLRNDGKETVDETTLTTFFFVSEGRPWLTRVPFLLPR